MKKLSYEQIESAENEFKEKELSLETKKKLVTFVTTHLDLNDIDFHKYAKSLGVEPPEAEEVIYETLYKLVNKSK